MRSSLKERIIRTLLVGGSFFMMQCVILKLFIGEEDWLLLSTIWSVAWTVGCFVSLTISNMEESIWNALKMDLIIILFIFILLVFVIGVVCDMANWKEFVTGITILFAVSMFVNNNWKKRNLN